MINTYQGAPIPVGFQWNPAEYERLQSTLYRDLLTLQNIYSRGIVLVSKADCLTQARKLTEQLRIETNADVTLATSWVCYRLNSTTELEDLPETVEHVTDKYITSPRDYSNTPELDNTPVSGPALMPERVYPDPMANPMNRPHPPQLPKSIRPY